MDLAHADEVALDGFDVVDEVEGQEGNVDVFPFDGVEQVEETLKQVDDCITIHAEYLGRSTITKMCF